MKKTWILPLLFIAFLFTRLYFIYTFPPFTDESLYIRWGMLMADLPSYRWASLEHLSRQPLALWLFGLASIWTQSPLIASRLVVLTWNIPSFFLIYFAVKKIYEDERALIAVAILALTPLFILTQSLALMDGLLFALASALFWIVSRISHRLTFTQLIAAGILSGVSLWIKSTSVILLLVVVLHIASVYRHHGITFKHLLIDLVIFWLIILFCMVPILFRPDFHYILSESRSFVPQTAPYDTFPVMWGRNILSVISSLVLYLGPLVILPVFFRIRRNTSGGIKIAAIWFALPLCGMTLISSSLRFRYIIIGTVGLLPLLSTRIQTHVSSIKSMAFLRLFWGCIAGYALLFVIYPVAIFSVFPATSGERDYALSWPSGYGIPELVRYINKQSESSLMVVAVADSPGNPSDYLLSYYYFSRNVRIVFATITEVSELKKISPLTAQIPVYLAVRESNILPSIRPYLKPVVRFEKPQNLDAISLYQIML